MEQINSTTAASNTSASSGTTPATAAEQTTSTVQTTSAESFEGILESTLHPDASGKVSEEDLFAGIIGERIKGLKGGGAYNRYTEILRSLQTSEGSHFSWEKGAKNALVQLGSEGVVTQDEVTQYYSQAFLAAQLDTNTAALFDGVGGGADTTVAVAATSEAIAAAKKVLVKIDAQELTAPVRDINEVPSRGATASANTTAPTLGSASTGAGSIGNPVDGADGFLFKPVAVSNGAVAVLLPENLAHKVETVVLKAATGEVLEEGRSTGYGELGTREKFSFTKPGASYPKDLTVEVRLQTGELISYAIPDPSQRYD